MDVPPRRDVGVTSRPLQRERIHSGVAKVRQRRQWGVPGLRGRLKLAIKRELLDMSFRTRSARNLEGYCLSLLATRPLFTNSKEWSINVGKYDGEAKFGNLGKCAVGDPPF
jgi:hypothetical protein